ncbi:MAG TPA: DUF3786 domain-containing protein [Candidatus Wunengus sp. YC60]|uniref:DUF3786 domain-containing protein n=1 Tax=Candidatus Wunengus sp. YC60 TaxID=3367697 RepID=UPI0040282F7F
MSELKTALDVYKILKKGNCGGCGLASCLAFAAAVISGEKDLSKCRYLDQEMIKKYGHSVSTKESTDRQMENAMEELKEHFSEINLAEAAQRIGAPFSRGKIIIRCMGKKVSVDREGNISTRIHVNPWLASPLYNYIISGGNQEPKGEWMHLRDLEYGKDWAKLFGQRCEAQCKKIADSNTEFFNTITEFFSGKKIKSQYEADISLVLWPLPRVPILFCYWKPDGDFTSELNIFFDSTAEKNLAIENIYTLGVGLVTMFSKIMTDHSHGAIATLNKLKKIKNWGIDVVDKIKSIDKE